MSRRRTRAAERKDARDETAEIAAGVRAVAREIAPIVESGALYWRAPLQFVAEQMSGRVCRQHGLAEGRADDVAAYLLAGLNEYVVALAGEFDAEHFEAWTAAVGSRGSGGAAS